MGIVVFAVGRWLRKTLVELADVENAESDDPIASLPIIAVLRDITVGFCTFLSAFYCLQLVFICY